MALIQCSECGKQISDKAISCPGCGAPGMAKGVDASPTKQPAATSNDSARPTAEDLYASTFPDTKSGEPKKMGPIGWVVTLGIAVAIGSCMFGGSSKQAANANRAGTDISDSKALSLCKQAIRLVSRDPDKAEIPYVAPSRIGSDYVYTWTPGVNTIRLRNGLGLDVPASARCAVNAALGQISKLDVNGNTIVH